MGPLGLDGFSPQKLPIRLPWVPLQVMRSVVEIRPHFLRFFSDSIRLFSEHFGALRRCLYRLLLRLRRGHQFGGDHPLSCAKANLI